MPLDVSDLIKTLGKSKLIAECPYCSEEFVMSQALLFDGRKNFPSKAEQKRIAIPNF